MSALKRATARDLGAALAVVILLGGAAALRPVLRAMDERPSSEECVELLDRYVEHVAHAAVADQPRFVVAIAERRAAARAVVEERGFPRCEAELTRDEVRCGLQASNADELERCLP
ncbi:hypothetical protein [Chondromyces apiculatus]|uniref:Uncharacterized protein n=1 Tax=Chondromyces apiculatus DSM 436 TaxID=1192034 RepID=A0A017T6M3_9BACT|nr:hypothetical protein [Chondromyces apiculatus]EYF04226.1 Hypothetical protein CAP_4703 [Chondromyces apiculatus DSM 436]